MKPEDLKKCAAALGISEEEFQKQYLDEGKPLAKAHSMAALHAHMEAMQTHHEAMHKAHGQMGTMHEKMATHIGKCMKACKGLMGTEDEADKAVKALIEDLAKSEKTDDSKGGVSAEEMQKRIDAAVTKAIGELPEKSNLRIIPRDSGELVKAGARDGSPFGV